MYGSFALIVVLDLALVLLYPLTAGITRLLVVQVHV